MDKNMLPVSKKKRRAEYPAKTTAKGKNEIRENDINVINLPNGNRIKVNAEHITQVIKIGSTIAQGIINIAEIREKGDQAVKKIEADIKKICEESDARIREIEQENKSWHEKFDKKKKVLFDMLERIENNPDWSDEVKKEIIKSMGTMINEQS